MINYVPYPSSIISYCSSGYFVYRLDILSSLKEADYTETFHYITSNRISESVIHNTHNARKFSYKRMLMFENANEFNFLRETQNA